jgi:hypothetical protein
MSNIAERIAKLPPARQQLLTRLLKQNQLDLSQNLILPRIRNENHAPLSFAQQRLWLVLQLDPFTSQEKPMWRLWLKALAR